MGVGVAFLDERLGVVAGVWFESKLSISEKSNSLAPGCAKKLVSNADDTMDASGDDSGLDNASVKDGTRGGEEGGCDGGSETAEVEVEADGASGVEAEGGCCAGKRGCFWS